jgi:co-chaperonin GroES (HSP10)
MSSPFGPTPRAGEPVADELVVGAPKARRGTTTAIALITGGAVVGGILASTLGASASSSNATTPSAVTAAVSSSAPAPSSTAPGTKKARPNFIAPLTGKVTAVGTDSVTIATTATSTAASTTNTYSVTSTTRISINESGPGALTGVKVGDTVFFNTTTSGGTVLADLRDGAGPAAGGFGGARGRGPGGPGFGGIMGVAPETGTVTAVGTDTVGIKTSTATTTYSVTSTSRIEKPGTAKATLSDVKVGDSVFFTLTTKGGTVIGNLFDGKLPTIAGHAFGGPGFGGRMGGGPKAPAASASPTTTGTNT